MALQASRNIRLDYVPRIEGEAGLDVVVTGREVSQLRLKIFEPRRFFRAFLAGRHYEEVPELVTQICGICPTCPNRSGR